MEAGKLETLASVPDWVGVDVHGAKAGEAGKAKEWDCALFFSNG